MIYWTIFFAIPTVSDSHSITSSSYIPLSDGTRFLRQEVHVQPEVQAEQSDQRLFVCFSETNCLSITRLGQSKSATGRFYFKKFSI